MHETYNYSNTIDSALLFLIIEQSIKIIRFAASFLRIAQLIKLADKCLHGKDTSERGMKTNRKKKNKEETVVIPKR